MVIKSTVFCPTYRVHDLRGGRSREVKLQRNSQFVLSKSGRDFIFKSKICFQIISHGCTLNSFSSLKKNRKKRTPINKPPNVNSPAKD